MKSHTERLINLVTYLLYSRVPVPWNIICDRMQEYKNTNEESAIRMFERDKAELKEIGIPIHYNGEGYSIPEEHYYLPEIELTPDEALFLQICNQSLGKVPGFNKIPETTTAVHKVTCDSSLLSPSDYAQDIEKHHILHFSSGNDTKRVNKLVKFLFDAILKNKQVSMEYYSIGKNEKALRIVDPYGMFLRKGIWYLVGKDTKKNDMRTYKVSRIHKISIFNKKSPEKQDFVVPKNFKIKDYLGRRAWQLAENEDAVEVKVKFSPEIAWWVQENFYDKSEVKMNSDGSCIASFKVGFVDSFIRWIMRISHQAEILAPSHVRNEIKHAWTEVLKKY